jgi:FMN phosphatase YigB (HAD superfamily)
VKTPMKDASMLNNYLYKTFGHTAIGLQKLGYEASISSYNDFVYKDLNYKEIFNDLIYTSKDDILQVRYLLDKCKKEGTETYIFSNSPSIWYENALYYMGLDTDMFGKIDMSNMIKPNKNLFHRVENQFSNKNKIIFVDDSFVNFSNTLMNDKWSNILFVNNDNMLTLPSHLNLRITKDISYIASHLDVLDTIELST